MFLQVVVLEICPDCHQGAAGSLSLALGTRGFMGMPLCLGTSTLVTASNRVLSKR